MEFKSFIETQFPVSKVSKESYKERKANYSQTLTGLGKWWGRKPLILVRAAILGLLMPTTDDPVKDREVFFKVLTMDDEGLWRRKKQPMTVKEMAEYLTPEEKAEWFSDESTDEMPRLKKGLTAEKKEDLQRLVFMRLSYDGKLRYCHRPEQIEGPSEEAWQEINAHLGTSAGSLPELVQQLGKRQFGHVPRVGDAFCGGGNIPFEAARIGCETCASDLSPVAGLLTWAALNIVGGGKKVVDTVRQTQQELYEAMDQTITRWGIEHNEHGWRADAYLYCGETICPECGWKVPLAPSWVIGEKSRCAAKLIPDSANKRFEIIIEEGVSEEEMRDAKEAGTVDGSYLICPQCPQSTRSIPLSMIRGDRRTGDGTQNGLRPWTNEDLSPRPDDIFQERLYCIRWVETYQDEYDNVRTRRHYRSPDENDFRREERVLSLLKEHFTQWQEHGYVPDRRIEPGDETSRLIRERGWTYWHHLFNPRQLLIIGLMSKQIDSSKYNLPQKVAMLLGLGRCIDWDSKLCRWDPGYTTEVVTETFYNRSLNTLSAYSLRTLYYLRSLWSIKILRFATCNSSVTTINNARSIVSESDIWLTDPPYADAINYHELSEFFLAWYEKHIPRLFPDWYVDSKRALAITGRDQEFRRSMVESYKNLAEHMPDNGAQVVMFTHQDAGVWADLAIILWAAGLRVTAAWCIATETDSALKDGNYVQGTVLLILRKQKSEDTAFLDEILPQVEHEVKAQLEAMLALEDQEDPNFSDTDYQLAAYAAALRVLTRYHRVEDIDVARELSRVRQKGEKSEVEALIEQAVEIACNYRIPGGFDNYVWKALAPGERFYLKGLDMERHGEYRSGAYQELARGFGVREYQPLLSSTRANQTRLRTPSEFGARLLEGDGFPSSLVRHVLFAVREVARTGEATAGKNWFRSEWQETYWDRRKEIIAVLEYLARLEMDSGMPHWKEEARCARLLAGAVENDHV